MTGVRHALAAAGLAAVMGLPAMVAHAGTLDPLQSQRAGVVVFEQDGYAGASASLGPGNRSAPFDAIHSIQVLDGYSAEVCTGSRGRGTCLPIAGSTRDLGTLLDDPVTWVKVRPQPQSRPTTTTTTTVTTTTTIRPAPTTAPPAPPTTAPSTSTTQPSRTSTTGAPAAPATTVELDRPDPPATTAPSSTVAPREKDGGDAPEEPTTTTRASVTTTTTTAPETTTTSVTTTTTTTTASLEDQDEDDVSAAGPAPPGPALPPTVVSADGTDPGWRLPTIAAVSIGLLALYTLLLIGRLQLWWGADAPLQPPKRGGS